ncbi:MAG: LCP family protein [Clostridiales bacterium]|nr:LCP family protein [Clostridiales bacterium]
MKREQKYTAVPQNSMVDGNYGRGGQRRLKRTAADYFGSICMILLLGCSLLLDIRLFTLNMLPMKYLLLVMVALLILNAINVIIQLPTRRVKTGKVVCGFVSLLLSAVMIYGVVAVGSLQGAINKIAGKLQQTEVIDVVILKDDKADTIADAKGYTFGILSSADTAALNEFSNVLSKEIGAVKTKSFTSITNLADALYDGVVDAVIMNDGFMDTLGDMPNYSTFSADTRVLYQYNLVTYVSSGNEAISGNLTKEPFLVYLSGTDARSSDLTEQSRSDVNILAAINPQTHQVLLINTPRDYYIPLSVSNGVKDKLTHAGLYGIDCSMGTLDMLYGTELQYYVRVNFAGFENVVDALGGVNVWSDYDFTTIGMSDGDDDDYSSYKSFSFVKGYNQVNGQQALRFVRERDAFSDGDNQRGKNQMSLIQAIIAKATSPAILAKYQSVLKAVSTSFATNISYDDISALVQMQLKNNADWNITTYAVTGTGIYSSNCYSMPGWDLAVMQADQTLVNNAKLLIRQVMNGETPDTSVLSD